MPRPILPEERLHPAIRERVATLQGDILTEVQEAVAKHDLVVVGMAQNPHPRKVLKALRAAGFEPHYLEYGSYLGQWRRRLALKMWTGWPTFPMVFAKGTLLGGENDTKALIASGELAKLLGR